MTLDDNLPEVVMVEPHELTEEELRHWLPIWEAEDEERDRKELLFDKWLNGDKRVKKESFREG